MTEAATDRGRSLNRCISRRNHQRHPLHPQLWQKSRGASKGFWATRGAVVFTMDADLQDNPKELPEMRQQLLDQNLDLVSGWKKRGMTL